MFPIVPNTQVADVHMESSGSSLLFAS
jgi:hypothetical protein